MAKSKQAARREAHGTSAKETFLLRLPPDLMETVRANAEAIGRPVSMEIQLALEAYYAAHPQTATARRRFA
jgi:hypothetical protein